MCTACLGQTKLVLRNYISYLLYTYFFLVFSSMITLLDILPYVSQNETPMYVHFDCFLPGFKTEIIIETKPKP